MRWLPRLGAAALLTVALSTPGPSAPSAATELRLPPVRKATLKNGLTVLVMPTHRVPVVSLRLVARAGSVNDAPGKEGLASLTADLVTQGAGTRTARQIANDIAFVGGTLEASAAAEQFTFTCDVLTKYYATGLELFRDIIVSPKFPVAEFARRKAERLGEIASQRDDPGTVADNELGPFLMGRSPLAHPAVGWTKPVKTLTRADVVAFHKRFITPANSMLAVVGDVDPDQVVSSLEQAFAGWTGAAAAGGYEPPVAEPGARVLIVNKPEVTQTQIRLAALGVPRNSPDYHAIVVANTILGGGFTSRLVNEIRVARGLTYGISSAWPMYRNAGEFVIETFTRNDSLRRCVDASLEVVRKLVADGPSQEELAKAKRYLTGQFPLRLQAADALAAQLLNIEFYGLDPRYLETYTERVNAVSMADVKRVLKERFAMDDLRILVVSDPKTAKPALEGLGAIAVQELR